MSGKPAAARRIAGDLAAVKFRLARIYLEWSVAGPTLEASTAMAAMAQEEAGHARSVRRMADGETSDPLPLPVLEKSPESWPELIGHVGAAELTLALILDGLNACGDADVRRHVAKMAVEERYHRRFYTGWFAELEGEDSAAGGVFRECRSVAEAQATDWLHALATPLAVLGAELGGPREAEEPAVVACVHCGSTDASALAAFGSSLLTSQMRCRSCGGHYDAVRSGAGLIGERTG
jgi:hypothetical protein